MYWPFGEIWKAVFSGVLKKLMIGIFLTLLLKQEFKTTVAAHKINNQ